ncbi:hypothetical protein [Oleiphilus sp. HI0128]|uniref:hypothetical protein n=1 Tax=Oleiphilus sp. HI0128 TaxID=1822267 RepID=UPI0012E85A80|nr:hypothetical protein [Oleiphilus sp. HI0128]
MIVEQSANKCTKCGCPKGASGDVTAKFQNPELYKSTKAAKSLQGILAALLLTPCFILVSIFQGKVAFFVLYAGSFMAALLGDKAFLKTVAGNSWAQKIIFCYVSFGSSLFGIRLYLDGQLSDSAIYWFAGIFMALYAAFFIYLKYSKQGVSFLEQYKSMRNN